MGFSGGGGSTGIGNHVHSNATGEGGALSNTSTLLGTLNLSSRIIIGV
ncbi:MAG: hypothetical protein HOB26_07515 [Flavobacteriales bacterium]|jgi:hypothetical protein|nr:hypothetical protein [Flavobacteriales bacterium]